MRDRERADYEARLASLTEQGEFDMTRFNEAFLSGGEEAARYNYIDQRRERLQTLREQEQARRAVERQRQQLENLIIRLSGDSTNDAELATLIERRRRLEEGLTQTEIKNLKTITVTDEMVSSLEEESCSICLDSFSVNMTVRKLTKCKHVFHQQCIDQWLARKGECPNCKRGLGVRAR